jgi:hypothetical protein
MTATEDQLTALEAKLPEADAARATAKRAADDFAPEAASGEAKAVAAWKGAVTLYNAAEDHYAAVVTGIWVLRKRVVDEENAAERAKRVAQVAVLKKETDARWDAAQTFASLLEKTIAALRSYTVHCRSAHLAYQGAGGKDPYGIKFLPHETNGMVAAEIWRLAGEEVGMPGGKPNHNKNTVAKDAQRPFIDEVAAANAWALQQASGVPLPNEITIEKRFAPKAPEVPSQPKSPDDPTLHDGEETIDKNASTRSEAEIQAEVEGAHRRRTRDLNPNARPKS